MSDERKDPEAEDDPAMMAEQAAASDEASADVMPAATAEDAVAVGPAPVTEEDVRELIGCVKFLASRLGALPELQAHFPIMR